MINLKEAKRRVDIINEKIYNALKKSGRKDNNVLLLAVSKTFPFEMVDIFSETGQIDFAENYAQEAEEKIPTVKNKNLNWHFIGHLQARKAKIVVPLFNTVHSLDSINLAKNLNKEAQKLNKILNVFIQVNVSGEESKSGIEPTQLADFYDNLEEYEFLKPIGLMTIPPFNEDSEKARSYFKKLYNLRESITPQLKELSMGMSGDYEVAIEEGATIIRIGTFLFGERTY